MSFQPFFKSGNLGGYAVFGGMPTLEFGSLTADLVAKDIAVCVHSACPDSSALVQMMKLSGLLHGLVDLADDRLFRCRDGLGP